MKSKKVLLFPLLRDIQVIPPTIAIINFLAEQGYKIVVYTYFTNVTFSHLNIEVVNFSEKSYPTGLIERVVAKCAFHLNFYKYFFDNRRAIEAIWMGAWDIWGINLIRGNIKLVYQYHEYEEHNFSNCRKADYVVVPEENRGWITYFKAKLKRKPLLLPNIPYYGELDIQVDQEILEFQNEDNIVVLYSGLIDNKKRNLFELVGAFNHLPENYILAIIPSFVKVRNDFHELVNYIQENGLRERVKFLDPRTPPLHLNTIATADIGIGFYNAISLNNVYAAPNRLYEFVNFGTPIILPNYPSFKALSMAYPYAVNVVESLSPKSIAEVITEINTNSDIAKKSMELFILKEGNYKHYASKLTERIFK